MSDVIRACAVFVYMFDQPWHVPRYWHQYYANAPEMMATTPRAVSALGRAGS
jgi:hypothetical protein